ncbi:MAG: RNA 2',3'-cyclic phosphodiesterase [Candidatus Nanohalobium sp.]
MRAFTAVDVEDDKLLKQLVEIREELNHGFNPVPREKMHLTLQFFQDLQEEDVDELVSAMKDVSTGPFSADVKGVGVFPSRRNVRVVWAGVKSDELHELKRQVSDHRVDADNRYDFKPHITLARVNRISRSDRKSFRKGLERRENSFFGELSVEKVKLFESVQTGDGTSYRVLEGVHL